MKEMSVVSKKACIIKLEDAFIDKTNSIQVNSLIPASQ